jgi:DNA-binding response OmpR family regulator
MFRILIYEESLLPYKETFSDTYRVESACTTDDILSMTFDHTYDLYIMHYSALQTIADLRESGDETAVIFTDDYYDTKHMKKAFLYGDDYLIRPLYLEDLAIRIDYHYRKCFNHTKHIVTYKDFYFHLHTRQLFHGSEKVKLSPNELTLLELLFGHMNKPLSKELIAERLESSSDGSLRVYISKLNKLGFDITYDRAITSYILLP